MLNIAKMQKRNPATILPELSIFGNHLIGDVAHETNL